MGSVKGVFEGRGVAQAEGGGLCGGSVENSAEKDQAGGVAFKFLEAGTDDFGASVFGGGIEDGAGLLGFAVKGKAAAGEGNVRPIARDAV